MPRRDRGAATVRWPGAVLIMAVVLALVGLLTLPGYHTTYNDRIFLPRDVPARGEVGVAHSALSHDGAPTP